MKIWTVSPNGLINNTSDTTDVKAKLLRQLKRLDHLLSQPRPFMIEVGSLSYSYDELMKKLAASNPNVNLTFENEANLFENCAKKREEVLHKLSVLEPIENIAEKHYKHQPIKFLDISEIKVDFDE